MTSRDTVNPPANCALAGVWRELISNHTAAGFHWFDRAAMRFFDSRILWRSLTAAGYAGARGHWFISSEQAPGYVSTAGVERDPRAYTVRFIREDGEVFTVGEFQQWATADEARAYMKGVITGRN